MAKTSQRILLVAIDEASKALIKGIAPDLEVETVDTQEALDEKYPDWADGQYEVAFCGDAIESTPALELAQLTKMQLPGTPKYFVTRQQSNLQRKALLKNGFDGAFWLPLDDQNLTNVLKNRLAERFGKVFKPVSLTDLDSSTEVPFDTYIYLQANQKYIRFSAGNSTVDEKRLSRLKKHEVGMLQVDAKDIGKFYEYSANRLRSLGKGNGAISETERKEKLNEAVRTLVFDIFDATDGPDFAAARDYMDSCQGVVSNYITQGKSSDWYDRVLSSIGKEKNAFDHSSNVSTYVALFAIAIGMAHPEDLAIAGLFHDLGETMLGHDNLDFDIKKLDPKDQELVLNHPTGSLNILKNKRLVVNATVEKAIAQHHERFDGKGYPKGLSGDRISVEGQLLSFADQFDMYTIAQPGQARVSPIQALDKIAATGSIGPALIRSLRDVFLKKAA